MEVTHLANVRNPSSFKIITLKEALKSIKYGTYKTQVDAARDFLLLGDEDGYRDAKSRLPSYSFNGTFTGKVINANFKKSSGLLHFDVDGLKREKLSKARDLLISDPTTIFVYRSPSGAGLKGATRIEGATIRSDSDFKRAFKVISEYWSGFEINFDPSCKDVRRVSFVGYDPELYYNGKAEVFNLDTEDYKPITLQDSNPPLPNISLEDAVEHLPKAGEQTYQQWLETGMALHHQFEGDHDALLLYDTWSQDVRKYQGFADVKAKWESFGKHPDRNTITFRTLLKHKKLEKDLSATKKIEKLLADCRDYMILTVEVAPKIWRLVNTNVVLEKDAVDALVLRYSQLRPNHTLSKTEAKRAMKAIIRQDRVLDADSLRLDNPRTPEWARNWVWVSAKEVFFNVKTRVALSPLGFRGYYDAYLPVGDGAPTDAGKYLRDTFLIPRVMDSMYVPAFPELFEFCGVPYVNEYNEHFRAEVPPEVAYTNSVKVFDEHLVKVCGGRGREWRILCNYFAAVTASPPQKVRWAPLLIGSFGDGKTVFRSFVAAAIGVHHTRSISCSTIISSATTGFSGWAQGVCFALIDELKLHGHNRHDVMNSLKVYITDDVVPLCKKGKEATDIPNTVNYMFCSNYLDATPIEEGNRRLMLIQSNFVLDSVPDDYFTELHEAVREGAGEIVAWLRTQTPHKDFNPNGHAPMTRTKKSVIQLSKDDNVEQVREALKYSNNPDFCEGALLFDSLFISMTSGYKGLQIESKYQLNNILTTLGYMKLGRVLVKGERHSIWGRRNGNVAPTQAQVKQVIVDRIKNHIPDEDLL